MSTYRIAVQNMTSQKGNKIANQFLIYGREQNGWFFKLFQSYDTTIAKILTYDGTQHVFLDQDYWEYSTTTGKYRNIFLNEKKQDTLKKIKSGEYQLINLN